jgi:putative methyltransferase (TIGR04325 family)
MAIIENGSVELTGAAPPRRPSIRRRRRRVMTLRRIARQILPPFIASALLRMMRGRETPEWEYVPGGRFHRGSPSATSASGWNVESVVRTQRAKWDRFVALIGENGGTSPLAVYHEAATLANDSLVAHHTFLSYGYVLARAAARDRTSDPLSILDWGSGLGHYFIVSRALLPDVTLDYHARDLPLLCEAGRAVLPEVTFHDTDADALGARRYDLIFASGSLQYHEAWRDILRGFATASRRLVYITRLPIIHQAPSFVVVQRPVDYKTEYQGWFFNREEFLAGAREAGLRLVREFLVDERPHAHGAPEQCEFRGFLFEVG